MSSSQPLGIEGSSNLSSSSLVVGFGLTTLLLFLTTLYLSESTRRRRRRSTPSTGAGGDDSVTKSSTAAANTVAYDREKYPGGRLSIYFGSQTGTAQLFARQLGAEAENRGFVCARTDPQLTISIIWPWHGMPSWVSLLPMLHPHV